MLRKFLEDHTYLFEFIQFILIDVWTGKTFFQQIVLHIIFILVLSFFIALLMEYMGEERQVKSRELEREKLRKTIEFIDQFMAFNKDNNAFVRISKSSGESALLLAESIKAAGNENINNIFENAAKIKAQKEESNKLRKVTQLIEKIKNTTDSQMPEIEKNEPKTKNLHASKILKVDKKELLQPVRPGTEITHKKVLPSIKQKLLRNTSCPNNRQPKRTLAFYSRSSSVHGNKSNIK